jgi:hypothetical protein
MNAVIKDFRQSTLFRRLIVYRTICFPVRNHRQNGFHLMLLSIIIKLPASAITISVHSALHIAFLNVVIDFVCLHDLYVLVSILNVLPLRIKIH